MIIRAGVVLTMEGPPIAYGAVRVENDRIATVSKSNIEHQTSNILELSDCVLLPGLINAHCHLEYNCLRGKIPRQNSFANWIRAINAEKAKLAPDDYLRSIAEGFCEARRFGTTSIVNLEAFPELIARAPDTALRTWWCAELIDVSAPAQREEMLVTAVEHLRACRQRNGGIGLAPHALFTASAELFQGCIEITANADLLLTAHLAESREEMQMFYDADGPLFDFLQRLGRPMDDCGGVTPLERFLRIIRDPNRWIVAHLNELSETDFELLAGLPARFSVAHSPRSHAYFGHSSFQFERLARLGYNICLATDSLASNTDLSLFAEMRECRKSRVPNDQIVKMVTVNPAKALGRAGQLGKIAPGYFADMIALPLKESADVYEQIIAFSGEVPWMMIGGEIV